MDIGVVERFVFQISSGDVFKRLTSVVSNIVLGEVVERDWFLSFLVNRLFRDCWERLCGVVRS